MPETWGNNNGRRQWWHREPRAAEEVEVNGVRLQYVEQGSGEPIVFVHGAPQNYSIATHADDLAKFITAINAGPVDLVGWSHGGLVAVTAALRDPSLVRSLILYEASVVSVLPAESPEGKIACEDRAKMFGPGVTAANAGEFIKAAKLLQEAAFQLRPGEFDSLPEDWQTGLLDNARVVALVFAAPPPPVITCDMLKDFTRPTLVMWGEKAGRSTR